jgi:hypothetical protein
MQGIIARGDEGMSCAGSGESRFLDFARNDKAYNSE